MHDFMEESSIVFNAQQSVHRIATWSNETVVMHAYWPPPSRKRRSNKGHSFLVFEDE